ncbi:DNA helicase HerA, contains HAS-barrel and ATPase domains [Halorientalis persicus]|uniref:DNA helicase HerA, contains HAS-barrel and ATPase domains n=1 Tax=Halorientalis persicus TaxID=1367881 RepID=A0A1H8MJ39_9EURY|nr:hypothetical protein [Halorientalis persicus]SEO17293.1 DNA helicase HerA, contains HAS-barrel and ATPase domains [Halorientalis persicus]
MASNPNTIKFEPHNSGADIGFRTKEFIRVTPSTEEFDEGNAITHLRALLDMKSGSGSWHLPKLSSDSDDPTIEFLALTEGEGRPIEIYYGADAGIAALKDRLEEIYPNSFEIERVNIDVERKLSKQVYLPVPKFVEHLKAGNLRPDYDDITVSTGKTDLPVAADDVDKQFTDERSAAGGGPADPDDLGSATTGDSFVADVHAEASEHYHVDYTVGEDGEVEPDETDVQVKTDADQSEAQPAPESKTQPEDESTDTSANSSEEASAKTNGDHAKPVETDGDSTSEPAEPPTEGTAESSDRAEQTAKNGSEPPEDDSESEDTEPNPSESVEKDSNDPDDPNPMLGIFGDKEELAEEETPSSEDATGGTYPVSGDDEDGDDSTDDTASTDDTDSDADDDPDVRSDGGKIRPKSHTGSNDSEDRTDGSKQDDELHGEDVREIEWLGDEIEYTEDGTPLRHIDNTIPLQNGDVVLLHDESIAPDENESKVTAPGPVAVDDDLVLVRPAPEGTSSVAARWRGEAEWRNDWMTTLGSDTRSPASKANRGTMMGQETADSDFNLPDPDSMLGPILNELSKSKEPLAFQVTINRKEDWKSQMHKRKVDVEDNTEAWLNKFWNMVVHQGDSKSAEDRELKPNEQRRLELMEAKTPKETWEANIRAVMPLTTAAPGVISGKSDIASADNTTDEEKRTQKYAEETLQTISRALNDLSGAFYRLDSEVLTPDSSWGRNNTDSITEYKSLLERRVNTGRGEEGMVKKLITGKRYYPHFVVGPAELLPLFTIPPEESLAAEVYRNTIERQKSENPLPRPNPQLLDEYREGLPVGYPIDQQGYPEEETARLPPGKLTQHIARFARTGAGKSIAVENDMLHLDENVAGPTILIDPKGDGLAGEFLQAYYKKHENLDSVYHFKAPDLIPAISFFDIRPQLAAGRAREDAIQSKVRQFHEVMAMVMGREEYEAAYAAKDIIAFLITALFDKDNNLNGEDEEGNPMPDPTDDAFTLKELYLVAKRMTEHKEVPKAPNSDRDIEKVLTRQFAKTDQSFQNSMSAVLNRFEKVMQDPQLWRAMNHVAEWDHDKGDYADDAAIFDFRKVIEDDDAVVLFDLGRLEEGKHAFSSLLLSVLWDAVQKRNMEQQNEYDKIVNLIIEEAAPITATRLVREDLIPESRSFGMSLEFVMQYPGQVKEESERAYEELFNDIHTKIFGNIEKEINVSEILATDTKPPEEMQNKLQQLPPGEWIASLPASKFHGQVPTPFSVRALDIPSGHPESSAPLTERERDRFEDDYDNRYEATLKQHAVDRPEVVDTAYYDGEVRYQSKQDGSQQEDTGASVDGESRASGAQQQGTEDSDNLNGHIDDLESFSDRGSHNTTESVGDSVFNDSKSDAEDDQNTGPVAAGPTTEGTQDDSNSDNGAKTIPGSVGLATESETDTGEDEKPPNDGNGSKTDLTENGASQPTGASGAATVDPPNESNSDAESQHEAKAAAEGAAEGSEPDPEEPAQESEIESGKNDTDADEEQADEQGLNSVTDLPAHITLTDDEFYECTICGSRFAPSKPTLAAQCCQFDSQMAAIHVGGYINAKYDDKYEFAQHVQKLNDQRRRIGLDPIEEEFVAEDDFPDHQDHNVDELPNRVTYHEPGEYRCEICHSYHTAGRWKRAFGCCDIEDVEEAQTILSGIFYEHDVKSVREIPSEQWAEITRQLTTAASDIPLSELQRAPKPTGINAGPWWETASVDPDDMPVEPQDGYGTTEDESSAETADEEHELSEDEDREIGEGLDYERDTGAAETDSDDGQSESVSFTDTESVFEEYTRERIKEAEAAKGLNEDDREFLEAVAHALADKDHPKLEGYHLLDSMNNLVQRFTNPQIEAFKKMGYLREDDTYRAKYYDLTDDGWQRVESVTKPTNTEGDVGENVAHRVGVKRVKYYLLEEKDAVESVETYHQPEGADEVIDVVGYGENGNVKHVAEVETDSNDYQSIRDDWNTMVTQNVPALWAVPDKDAAETVLRALKSKVPEFREKDYGELESVDHIYQIRDWALFDDDENRIHAAGITDIKSLKSNAFKGFDLEDYE